MNQPDQQLGAAPAAAAAPEPGAALGGRVRGLRIASLAAVVMLLIEYGFGIWVNLYGQLPAADHGAGAATGFGRAITDGPAGLTIHALLGVALLASAITIVVRAILARRGWPIALAVLGLCAIGVSAINGSRFVGDPSNAASFAMGLAAAVAILCYVIIGFAATARLRS